MNFIKLSKYNPTSESVSVHVRIDSIVLVEVNDENSTYVELSNGNRILVSDCADDILQIIMK